MGVLLVGLFEDGSLGFTGGSVCVLGLGFLDVLLVGLFEGGSLGLTGDGVGILGLFTS